MLTRRRFLAAGALGGLLIPNRIVAQHSLPGGGELTTVSDGSLVLPGSFVFAPMPKPDVFELLTSRAVPQDQLTPECNLALLCRGDRTVLFDAGAGPDFQPSAGQLLEGLAAAGVAPEDITDVVFTHAHPDHIWGVLDDFDEPLFANATHHIGAGELAYWSDPATVDNIGEARATFAVGARRRLDAIAAQLQVFEDGDEVLPGVEAILTPGHTPGHMAFQVEDRLILGDAIGNHHVAFARPDWPSGSDQDQALAAQTRVALFDRIAADNLSVVGFHLPQGGMGQVEAGAGGYRFVPT